MDLQLNNKTALITGGSSGIGLAVAKNLIAEGVRVVVCAREEQRITSVVEELRHDFGSDVIYGQQCDVTKLKDLEALASFIDQTFGGLDILINNAGTGSEETNLEAADEKWYYYWDLHVMAAIRLSRLCVPLMNKWPGEGVIINTASICATQPLYYEPIYNVTKAALNMYSKCLAEELVNRNIRVNSISPGLVLTSDWLNTADILGKQEGISAQEYLGRIAHDLAPINRFASPEEIASFYTYICSPIASYCLGTNFYIDGGATQGLK